MGATGATPEPEKQSGATPGDDRPEPGAGRRPPHTEDADGEHGAREAAAAHPGEGEPASEDGRPLRRAVDTLEGLGVESGEADQIVNAICETLLVEQEIAWGGLLPHPESFSRYPEHVQERIMRWNDAFTTDESQRQDRLVECEISEARRGSTRTTWFLGICLVLAALAVFVFDTVAGGALFLSVPVLSIIGGFIRDVRSNSSRRSDG